MDSADEFLMVTRYGGPSWKFGRTRDGHYECKKRVHTYRIMMDGLDSAKPIWIGQVLPLGIVTVEAEIKARSVQFMFGTYFFSARA